jgi:threonine synthase
MAYFDTQTGAELAISSLEAILEGKLAARLIVKDPLPKAFTKSELASLKTKNYSELAALVISRFFADLDPEMVSQFTSLAYSQQNFDHPEIVPIAQNENCFYAEQWHGKTAAFKDIALSILPYFLSEALKKSPNVQKALILGATSGDTGSAGEAGFQSVENVAVAVLFPEEGRVSEIQKQQMIDYQTTDGRISAYSLKANFDYCQSEIVKPLLDDREFRQVLLERHQAKLTSLNSINIGRLAPQIVTFVKAYLEINAPFVVSIPTGNFGHALAAFYAREMGVPIERIVIATNQNDVLYRFFNSGKFELEGFHYTNSPSMDIAIPSNLERLLYYLAGNEKVQNWMSDLKQSGSFQVDAETLDKLQVIFQAEKSSDAETLQEIKRVYAEQKRILDPHTAVGSVASRKLKADLPVLLLETAHWGKFPQTIIEALKADLSIDISGSDLEKIQKLNNYFAQKNAKPLLPKFLADLKPSEHSPRKSGFKPSLEEVKEILLGQVGE